MCLYDLIHLQSMYAYFRLNHILRGSNFVDILGSGKIIAIKHRILSRINILIQSINHIYFVSSKKSSWADRKSVV